MIYFITNGTHVKIGVTKNEGTLTQVIEFYSRVAALGTYEIPFKSTYPAHGMEPVSEEYTIEIDVTNMPHEKKKIAETILGYKEQ